MLRGKMSFGGGKGEFGWQAEQLALMWSPKTSSTPPGRHWRKCVIMTLGAGWKIQFVMGKLGFQNQLFH